MYRRLMAIFVITLSCLVANGVSAQTPGGSNTAATSLPSSPSRQNGVPITVPDGTVVLVQLVDPLSTAVNVEDDVFDLNVVDAVTVNGYTIIEQGAKGRGRVVKVDKAGGHGHPGSIVIRVDYVYSVDGLKIRIKPTPISQEGAKAQGGAAIAGFLTYGIASNAVRGGEATLATTRMMTVHVDGTVHVISAERAANGSDDGFAK